MSPKLVVIGMSGRALAQSAAKSGERVIVLDVFADRDTRAVAEVACVAADDRVAIDPERLLTALAAEARGCGLGVVIGSGLEQAPELLSRVAAYGRLYANDPRIISALKDPELGIALLSATGWSVPVTRREPPDDRRGWLQKEVGGAGGVHIRQAGDAPAGPRVYFQREARGQPMSATFLADGDRARLLGFNRLRVAALGEAAFCYAGAVAGAALAPALRRQVQLRLDRLVRVTGLRGLAGLDFLRDGELLTALEVNPRPTATFELYDDDFPEGLVHWHKLSFERSVPEFDARVVGQHGRCRALGVVYAPHPISIPRNAAFPAWCRDLPGHGSTIAAGAPVVSVFAEAANVELAEREIDARGRAVRALLKGWRGAEQRAVA